MDSVTTWHDTHTHCNEVGFILTPHLLLPIMNAEPSDRPSWSWWTTSHHSAEDHNLNSDFLTQFVVSSARYVSHTKWTIKVHGNTYCTELQHVRIRAVHHKNTPGFRLSLLYKAYFLTYRLIQPPYTRTDTRHKASKHTELFEHTNIQHVMLKPWRLILLKGKVILVWPRGWVEV